MEALNDLLNAKTSFNAMVRNYEAEVENLLEEHLSADNADGLEDVLRTLNPLEELKGNEIVHTARAVVVFHKGTYEDFLAVLHSYTFHPRWHTRLQHLWYEAHYKHYEETRKTKLGPVAKYRIRKRHPLPRTIWDGEKITHWFKDSARNTMSEFFAKSQYPSWRQKEKLCRKTGLNIRQVSNWFKNKRARVRLQTLAEQAAAAARQATMVRCEQKLRDQERAKLDEQQRNEQTALLQEELINEKLQLVEEVVQKQGETSEESGVLVVQERERVVFEQELRSEEKQTSEELGNLVEYGSKDEMGNNDRALFEESPKSQGLTKCKKRLQDQEEITAEEGFLNKETTLPEKEMRNQQIAKLEKLRNQKKARFEEEQKNCKRAKIEEELRKEETSRTEELKTPSSENGDGVGIKKIVLYKSPVFQELQNCEELASSSVFQDGAESLPTPVLPSDGREFDVPNYLEPLRNPAHQYAIEQGRVILPNQDGLELTNRLPGQENDAEMKVHQASYEQQYFTIPPEYYQY